jgi:hypothetical protein
VEHLVRTCSRSNVEHPAGWLNTLVMPFNHLNQLRQQIYF